MRDIGPSPYAGRPALYRGNRGRQTNLVRNFMNLPQHVRLVEVGPRDGLQNEKQPISVADKVRLTKIGRASCRERV